MQLPMMSPILKTTKKRPIPLTTRKRMPHLVNVIMVAEAVTRVVFMAVMRAVTRVHMVIMNTIIINMVTIIMITVMNFMKSGENTVDTKANIMDTMKEAITVNTDTTMIMDIVIPFLRIPKQKKLHQRQLHQKPLHQNLPRNGG